MCNWRAQSEIYDFFNLCILKCGTINCWIQQKCKNSLNFSLLNLFMISIIISTMSSNFCECAYIFRSNYFCFKCYILTFEDWLAICFIFRFDPLCSTCSTFTLGSYPFIWCAFRFIYRFLNQTKKPYFCSTFTLWSCPFIQCTFKYVLC
jgi:hypothetical protein